MLHKQISRRVFISGSLYLVSASLFATVFDNVGQLTEIKQNGQFFNAAELTTLTDIAEIMIPKTETPGATDAHVIPVLDGLMLTWAGANTKLQFKQVIEQVELFAKEAYSQSYLSLSLEQRSQLITQLDKTAFNNKQTALSESYRKLKKIIFHVYYTSEQANPDFVLIPGGYRGDLTQAQLAEIQKRGYL